MEADLKLIAIGSRTRYRLLLVRLVLRREVGSYWSDWFSDGRSASIGQIGSQTRGRLLLVRFVLRREVGSYWSEWFSGERSAPIGQISSCLSCSGESRRRTFSSSPSSTLTMSERNNRKVSYQISLRREENFLRDEGTLEYIGFYCIPAERSIASKKAHRELGRGQSLFNSRKVVSDFSRVVHTLF